MKRTPLDMFEINLPDGMRSYLRNYGYSFGKKACMEAVKKLKRLNPATGKMETLEALNKEQVEEMLTKHGIKLEHNVGYDFVYAANYGKAVHYKSSITDEKQLALYVKDRIDNPLMPGGNEFREWLVRCDALGIPVDWDEIL
ncbi:MAG: hypothetical protein K1V90_08765 [Muribaculaceae bacterium]|jgi:hypothetical protein